MRSTQQGDQDESSQNLPHPYSHHQEQTRAFLAGHNTQTPLLSSSRRTLSSVNEASAVITQDDDTLDHQSGGEAYMPLSSNTFVGPVPPQSGFLNPRTYHPSPTGSETYSLGGGSTTAGIGISPFAHNRQLSETVISNNDISTTPYTAVEASAGATSNTNQPTSSAPLLPQPGQSVAAIADGLDLEDSDLIPPHASRRTHGTTRPTLQTEEKEEKQVVQLQPPDADEVTHKKIYFGVAFAASIVYFMNGLMAIQRQSPEHAPEVFEQNGGIIFLALTLASAAFGVNLILNYDFFPRLVKDLIGIKNKLLKPSHEVSPKEKAKMIALFLPPLGTALGAGIISWESFEFISDQNDGMKALKTIACLLNAFIGFGTTLATRYAGTLDLWDKYKHRNNPNKKFQHLIRRALKRLSPEDTQAVQAIMVDVLQAGIIKKKPHEVLIQDLLLNEEFQTILKKYNKTDQNEFMLKVARYTLAAIAGLAGLTAYGQKANDCVNRFSDTYKNAFWLEKVPLFVIGGLPTAALYFTAVVEAFPMLYNSQFKQDNKRKAMTFLMAVVAGASCASMFNVATNITNNPSQILFFLPSVKEDGSFESYLYPITVAFLGAFSVNVRSVLKRFVRNISNSMDDATVNTTLLFDLEQSRNFQKALDKLEKKSEERSTAEHHTSVTIEADDQKSPEADSAPLINNGGTIAALSQGEVIKLKDHITGSQVVAIEPLVSSNNDTVATLLRTQPQTTSTWKCIEAFRDNFIEEHEKKSVSFNSIFGRSNRENAAAPRDSLCNRISSGVSSFFSSRRRPGSNYQQVDNEQTSTCCRIFGSPRAQPGLMS